MNFQSIDKDKPPKTQKRKEENWMSSLAESKDMMSRIDSHLEGSYSFSHEGSRGLLLALCIVLKGRFFQRVT